MNACGCYGSAVTVLLKLPAEDGGEDSDSEEK